MKEVRHKPRVSLVISTYEWPEALDRVLDSASRQTWPDLEILVADDGSGPATAAVVDAWRARSRHPVRHVWQEDRGFRLSASRNRAVERASGDYLLFVDGDCLMRPRFVEAHMRYAERGWFTTGKRCYLRRGGSRRVLDFRLRPDAWPWPVLFLLLLFGGGTRAAQVAPLPRSDADRRSRALDWDQAQGCNLGLWRDDYRRIGGFDERFESWGGEDTDLVRRLFRAGVRRLVLEHNEPVLHLWHPRRSAQSPPTREKMFAETEKAA